MKTRLLDLLLRTYPHKSRDELYAAVLCGEVAVGGETLRDPAAVLDLHSEPELREAPRYVSRGGYKLEHALTTFRIDVRDRVVLDAGSSTGGFTDCLLAFGARLVHAVDVGYNQLAYRLRTDPRVMVRERTNVMDLAELSPVPDLVTADLSFRSLRRAAGHLLALTRRGEGIMLVKPQFEEASRRKAAGIRDGDDAGFSGIVRDEERSRAILEETLADLAAEGLVLREWVESPILGRKGNREYLVHLNKGGDPG